MTTQEKKIIAPPCSPSLRALRMRPSCRFPQKWEHGYWRATTLWQMSDFVHCLKSNRRATISKFHSQSSKHLFALSMPLLVLERIIHRRGDQVEPVPFTS